MGSPVATMGAPTMLLVGLSCILLAGASPVPDPNPEPFIEPFGLLSSLLGIGGSQHTLKKPKKEKKCKCPEPEQGYASARTFNHKKKKEKKCDCPAAPEEGYGVPAQPVLQTYTPPCTPSYPGRRRRSPNHPQGFNLFSDGGIFSPELAADFHGHKHGHGKKREKRSNTTPAIRTTLTHIAMT